MKTLVQLVLEYNATLEDGAGDVLVPGLTWGEWIRAAEGKPPELCGAKDGPYAATYDLSAAKTKAAKVRLIGNSVVPQMAAAIIKANSQRGAQ